MVVGTFDDGCSRGHCAIALNFWELGRYALLVLGRVPVWE